MFRLRYVMALVLVLALLIVGGIGVYLLTRAFSPGASVVEPGAPVIVRIVAAYPGATAEEVEKRVTIPLEVGLAGLPGVESVRSKSLPGLSGLHVRFKAGTDLSVARHEIINRLQFIQELPAGVSPQLRAALGGKELRYVLTAPRDPQGRPLYTAHDLKVMQEWIIARELRRLPGIAEVHTSGGANKVYEIQPDPDRLRRYGVSLEQLAGAVAAGNANVGGALVRQGDAALMVRGGSLLGGGQDPVTEALGAREPTAAAALLRKEEERRLQEIGQLVVASVRDVPIRVRDLAETALGLSQVGWVAYKGDGAAEEDAIMGLVRLRPGEDVLRLHDVEARLRELNAAAGRLLPGVRIEPFYTATGRGDVLWVHGTLPPSAALERAADLARQVGDLLRQLPEVERVVAQAGRSDDGLDLQSANQIQVLVCLKADVDERTRQELRHTISARLSDQAPGAAWIATANDPSFDFPSVPGEHLLKIMGPDLAELERLAEHVQAAMRAVEGVENVNVLSFQGMPQLDLQIDREKCARWGISFADVNDVLRTALGDKVVSSMIEGDRTVDIVLRWPSHWRDDLTAILELPVDVKAGVSGAATPRRRLRDLLKNGEDQGFLRLGAAVIYREDGERLLPVRFTIGDRSLTDVEAEATEKIAPLLKSPYRIAWGN
jgi:Cu/Ag efflux pump CusA